jgi:hypothetical protein
VRRVRGPKDIEKYSEKEVVDIKPQEIWCCKMS